MSSEFRKRIIADLITNHVEIKMSRSDELFPCYPRQYRHNNDTDGSGEFVAAYDKDIKDHATRIIKELEAQVKNRELQIAKMALVEQIGKLEAAVQREDVCSHYKPDCPVHREIS